MSAHRATFRNTVLLVLSILVGLPAVAGATHYPTGSSCYDCHAVSKSKMVLGTHLIKKSQKTSDLGVTGGAPIPCLFCHEDNAVSVTRTNMLGVWGHFDATSQSKHPVDIFSTGSGNPAALDCLDCHTGISAVVVSDGAGNATVHGKDAATQTLDVYTETLVGAPANQAALSVSTCQAAVCHDADGGGVGDYNAPARHTIAKTTINDGAAPTACTQCHGKHNSYQNDSLIVLRTDGTTSNNPTDALSGAVTPDKCGECHDADDGGAGSPWLADGHGRSDVGGGALTCTSCHDAAVPHSFSASATGTNDLRFALSFDAGQTSTLTSKMTYSVCLTCHSTLTGKAHGPQNVGCIDCHEPHGKGVGANIKMVRTQIPVASPTDTIQFTGSAGVSVAADFTDWGNTRGNGASGTSLGICDNVDCHGGSGYTPATTYTTGGTHTGGVLTSGTDCSGCHNHTDTNGGWGAGASCTNCHGFPPTSNAHITHVTDSNLGCLNCHPDPGTVNHNESGVADQTEFDNLMLSSPGTIRNNVDVAFTQAVYTTGSYLAAKGARANDTTTYYDCTTACHGGSLPAATQGTDIQPTWNVASSGACGTCHKADDVNTPGTNNHVKHANTAAGRGFTCQTCHAGTYDGANLLAAHLDGDSATDVVASGTFNSVAVNIAYTAPNCTTISCHGNYSAVAWGATEGNCANCHGTFDGTYNSTGGMVGAVAKHKEADWTNNLGGDNTTYFGVAHKPGAVAVGANREGYCDYCHANTQPAYTAGMHIDGSVQLNSSMAYAGVSGNDGGTAGCASACHVQTTPYLMSDSTLPLAPIVGAGFGCGACHNDGTVPPTSGAHTAHLDSARGAAWTNTGDFSACEACHGLPPDGVANGWADNNYEHNNGTLAFADNIPAGEGTVTYSDGGTPGTGAAANDDTCSTSDCHSASPQVATWGTPTSVNCDQCHYGTTGTPTSAANTGVNAIGGSHNAHFDATGRNVVCTDCHADAAGQIAPRAHIDNVSGADDKTKLIDKANATQDEATVTAAALNTGSDADPGNPVCNNTQCHNPSADGHASPAWGTASASCELCHNAATAPATATGSHVKHVTTMGYACTACHPDNGINYGHSSQVVDFPTITYTGNAASYPGTYGSCSAGACHAGSLVWGGTPTICSDCHSGTGDTNNFVGNDSTATVVDNTEWTTYGHGAKAKGCLDCHDMAVAHDTTAGLTGTNPFRLKTGFTCTNTAAGCHQNSPAKDVVSHTQANMGAAGYTTQVNVWTFNPECVNCHDPHGDGTNLKMIQKELYDKATFNVDGPAAGPPPAVPTEQTNLVFTDNTTGASTAGTSFADLDAPFSSLCQECHETTDPDMTSFKDNTSAASTGHPSAGGNPGTCTNCHKHSSAFTPAGCTGCHGGSQVGKDDGRPYTGDGRTDTVRPNAIGAHDTHIDNVGLTCEACHYNGSTQSAVDPGHPTSGSSDITTGVVAGDLNLDVADIYQIGAAVPGYVGKFEENSGVSYKICSNISCHYGDTPDWDMRAQCTSTGTISTTSPANGGTVTENTNITISVSATGTTGGTEEYRIDAGTWTPLATQWATGAARVGVTVESRAQDATCGTYVTSSVNTFDVITCVDGDPATLTTTNPATGNVSGTVTVQTQVGSEPGANMTGMAVTIAGSTACNVTGQTMTWNAGAARWEYSWNTSACGTSTPETGVTINVSGTDPDCGGSLKSAGQVTVTIDNGVILFADIEGFESTTWDGTLWTNVVEATAADVEFCRANTDGPSGGTGTFGAAPQGSWFAYAEASTNGSQLCGATSSYTQEATLESVRNTENAGQGMATADYNNGNLKVQFRYHMEGAGWTTGLDLQMQQDGGAWNSLWNSPGNTGLTWQQTPVITVNPAGTYFKLRIQTAYSQYQSDTGLDEIVFSNDGTLAPPSKTGGGTATACDTCHEFGPNDDTLDASNHPNNPASTEYIYAATGDHQKHLMGDAGSPTSPTAADAAGLCDKCHPANVTSYTNTHTNGTKDLRSGTIGNSAGTDNGTYDSVAKTCSNVNCHNNAVTPVWGTGTVSCTSCHGQGAGVPWPNVGAHNAHFTAFGIASLTDAAAPTKCDYCHTGYGAGTAFHADGNAQQVAISATFQDKTGGALGYSGGTDGACSNVSCHGGAVTPAWSTGTLAATTEAGCTTCHGVARGEYNDPVSGKHPAHVTTAGKLCTDCHGTTPVATHFSDTQLATTALQNPTSFNGANVTYSDSTTTGPPYYSAAGSSGTCTTVACHSGGVNWDPTATGGCNFCHGYPPLTDGSANDKHATGATPVNHTITADSGATLLANHDDCTTCHGTKDDGAGGHTDKAPYVTATNHQNTNITMNGPSPATGAGYNATNFGCDNACHNNDVSHRLSDSAMTVEYLDLGAGACDACHGPGGSGPTVVWPTGNATGKDNVYGSHLKALTGDALSGTTDWAVQCKKCHPFHSGGSATVGLPPTNWNGTNMQTQLGIDYTTHGGIYLGGTSTTGTTEAEICWNCHSTNSISEWGLNTDTNGAANNFDFGSLTTPNWTTATWNSANFTYKSGAIESTHSVNFTAGSSAVTGSAYNYTESPDAVANIRCSYCHDVHDLNKAVSDTSSLPPHLRGTWMGNPYKEDGAPQSGTTYPNDANKWGGVPRGSTGTTTMGGYWIDANSGNPTSGWTLTSSAGLCTLCHGTNVDGMDLTTGESLWVGTNGHSNAVIGGTGSAKFNVFDAHGGQSGNTNNPYQHFQGFIDPADNGSFGFRSENSNAWRYTPAVDPGNNRPRKYNSDNWAVDETGATTETQYHKFSCSKCHNPHASRRPKLMISNCLDTKHNTWDNNYQINSSGGSNNNNRSISNWTSAQNCHRLGGNDPSDTRDTAGVGNGWNKVTPW